MNHFLEDLDPAQERDNCIVPVRLWTRWVENQSAEVLLVELRQGSTRILLCVEGHQNQSEEHIYIPHRYFTEIAEDEICFITVVNTMPPNATKIELQLVDSEIYHIDISEAASKVLSHWNILSVGTIVSVPCEEMDGYLIDVIVKSCEPEDTVLLRGEVPLEIAEPLIKGPSWYTASSQTTSPTISGQRPSTPIPETSMPFTAEDFNEIIPIVPVNFAQETSSNTGFTPFSGKGRTLG